MRENERRDNELAERIADSLRESEVLAPDFEARLMARARAEVARRQAIGSRRGWWFTARVFVASPLTTLAMAAGIAVIAAASTLGVARRGPVPLSARSDAVEFVRFVLVDSTARSVAIVGDFNGWRSDRTPLVAAPKPGVWSVSVPLSPGRHEYAFIVDGERWVVDPASIASSDEFGTESSVLLVAPARGGGRRVVIRWGRAARRVLPLLCVPHAAWAQRVSSSLDIGGAAMRYADSLSANGGSLSPALAIEWPRGTLGGAATFSHFPSGWSSQAAMNASVFSRTAGLLVGELAATAGGSAHQDGTHTGQGLGSARAHLMADRSGAWLGGGSGRTWDGADWRSVIAGEIGAWMKAGDATLVASSTPTAVDDSVRYTDSQLSARWSGSSIELGAEIRRSSRCDRRHHRRIWATLGQHCRSFVARPRVGVILSGGTYPIDLTQGFPGGRFLTFSMRIRSSPPRVNDPHESNGGVSRRTPSEPVPTFRALPPSRGLVIIEVTMTGARSVEVSGDFTLWKPVRLTPSPGGVWRVSLPMVRGTHQINLRVNGDQWIVPPGLTPITDEFGGVVGLLVVE